MNRSDLIEELAKRHGLARPDAEEISTLIFDMMQEALAAGKRIEIRGFGSLVVKDYQSYWGRNPKTGAKIRVAAKRLPTFKLGKELRFRLNENISKDISKGNKSAIDT